MGKAQINYLLAQLKLQQEEEQFDKELAKLEANLAKVDAEIDKVIQWLEEN